jgi:hypothetical protein
MLIAVEINACHFHILSVSLRCMLYVR